MTKSKYIVPKTGEKSAPQSSVFVTLGDLPPKKVGVKRTGKGNTTCLRIFGLLFAVVGLTLAVVCSYYLYQLLRPQQPYSQDLRFLLHSSGDDDTSVSTSTTSPQYLDEHVEVSDDEDLETIRVPKFDEGDEAVFVHDFKQGMSLIKVDTDRLCYVLPLNRELIPQPRDLLEFLRGIATREYILDADMIKANYEVVQPELDTEIMEEMYGARFANMCAGYQSYTLQEMNVAGLTTTTAAPYVIQRKFVMYPGGSAVIQYYIYRR